MIKKNLILFLMLTSQCFAFSFKKKNEVVINYEIRNYFYQICLDVAKGKSTYTFRGIDTFSTLMNVTYWTFDHGAIRYCDFLWPEYMGYIDSYGFYDSGSDSAFWLKTLITGEENEFVLVRPKELDEGQTQIDSLIAQTDESNENSQESYQEEYDEVPVYEVPQETLDSIVERRLKNAEKALVFHSYADEVLSLQRVDGKNIIIRATDKELIRNYFDSDMRLIKKEIWSVSGGLSSAKIQSSQEFTYGDGLLPLSSVLTKDEERYSLFYDKEGRIVKSLNYKLINNRYVLYGKSEWAFNINGKLSEKKYEEYIYRKNSVKVITKKIKKREVYEYIIENAPDYYYYEDDELRLHTVHTSEDSYITTMFFDHDYNIESYYEKGMHIKDIFYVKGRVRRVKNYAQ